MDFHRVRPVVGGVSLPCTVLGSPLVTWQIEPNRRWRFWA